MQSMLHQFSAPFTHSFYQVRVFSLVCISLLLSMTISGWGPAGTLLGKDIEGSLVTIPKNAWKIWVRKTTLELRNLYIVINLHYNQWVSLFLCREGPDQGQQKAYWKKKPTEVPILKRNSRVTQKKGTGVLIPHTSSRLKSSCHRKGKIQNQVENSRVYQREYILTNYCTIAEETDTMLMKDSAGIHERKQESDRIRMKNTRVEIGTVYPHYNELLCNKLQI